MDAINIQQIEECARHRLSDAVYAFVAGGAANEVTLRRNKERFSEIMLLPHVLTNVHSPDTGSSLSIGDIAAPLVIAPMSAAQLAHTDGENALGRSASAYGIPYCASMFSSLRIEELVTRSAQVWFQAYFLKDREEMRRIIERAEASGCTALVITVDAPVAGLRERMSACGSSLPRVTLGNFCDEPVDIVPFITSRMDPCIGWADIEWLHSICRLPIVLKGVLRPDDAQHAIDHGVSAIVVSNHGGRQLDTVLPTIDALPPIAETVGGRLDVLLDGGVRRGSDVLKALALGARAVLIGRPAWWGLACGGEQGVSQVIEVFQEELKRAMHLCGCRSIAEITPDLLQFPDDIFTQYSTFE